MIETQDAEGPDQPDTRTVAAPKPHFVALDSLRGIAALAVVLFHVEWHNPLYSLRIVKNSYLMVDFFFVLSGFVIFYAYGARIANRSGYVRFLWLRFWRLYPLHLTFLAFFFAIECAKAYLQWRYGMHFTYPAFVANSFTLLLGNLLLLQATGIFSRLGFNSPSWSISAEFYTYVIFGLIVLLLPRTRRILFTAALICAGSVITLVLLGPQGISPSSDFGILRCLTGFCLGMLTFAAYQHLRQWRIITTNPRMFELAALAALTSFVVFLATKTRGESDFAVGPLSALVVLSVALAPAAGFTRFLRSRPMVWLGTISYSIYIDHNAVLWTVYHALTVLVPMQHNNPGPVLGFVALVFTFGVVLLLAHITYHWIEQPWRNWSKAVWPHEAAANANALPTSS